MNDTSSWWALGLGRRLWLALEFLLWPLKVLALLIEISVGAVFLGGIGLIAAWWYHLIPDQDVITLINSLAGRGLGILQAQGMLHMPAATP